MIGGTLPVTAIIIEDEWNTVSLRMLTADEHGGFIEDGGKLLILLLLASSPIFRSSSSERRNYV